MAVTYTVKGWFHRHRSNSQQGTSGTDIPTIGIGSPVIIHHPSSSYCFLLHGARISYRNFDDKRHSDRNSSNRRLSAPLPAATAGYQHTHHRPSLGTKGGIQSKWNKIIIRTSENNNNKRRRRRGKTMLCFAST